MKTINNYWVGGTPLGGRRAGYEKPSAKNIDGYLAPLTLTRIKQDPQTWKDSLVEAEIPLPLLSFRVKLQQMYIDTVMDGHVTACMQRRKDLVMLKDFCIEDYKGNIDEAATKIINTAWFKSIINHTLDAQYYGYTLLGLGDIVNGVFKDINLLRRHNVSPDRLNIAQVPYSPGGIEFMNPDIKDEFGNSYYDWTLWLPTPSDFGISPCGYGMLYKVSLYQVLLRNNLADNTTYNELFGQPLRIGKTNKKDEESRRQFGNSLDLMGSRAWMVIDEEDKIEFEESNSGSGRANGTYDNLEQRLEKKITKIILGHEDAISSTPGKLGSSGKDNDGSGKALRDKEKNDSDFVESSINDHVIPKLIKLGFRIPIGKRFKFKNDWEKIETRLKEDNNNSVTADIVKTLADSGLEVDEKYITERTGIPVVKKEVPTIKNPNIPATIKNKLENLYKK